MMLSDYGAALEDSTRSIHLDESYTKVSVVMLYSALFPSCGLSSFEDSMLVFQHKKWTLFLFLFLLFSTSSLPFFLSSSSPSPPTSSQGYLRAAKCHLMLGNPSLSIDFYHKVLHVQPHHKQAKEEVGGSLLMTTAKLRIRSSYHRRGLNWIKCQDFWPLSYLPLYPPFSPL